MSTKRKRSESGDGDENSERKMAKTEDSTRENEPKLSYEDSLQLANKIAEPMASKKLYKKLSKLAKKVAGEKKMTVMGLKNVRKHIRRKLGPGLVLLAGDVLPIDIYSHMAIVCEDAKIPYCYIPTRQYLAKMFNISRSVMIVLIKKTDNKHYKESEELISLLPAHF